MPHSVGSRRCGTAVSGLAARAAAIRVRFGTGYFCSFAKLSVDKSRLNCKFRIPQQKDRSMQPVTIISAIGLFVAFIAKHDTSCPYNPDELRHGA